MEEEAEKALHKSTSGPVIALIDKCPPDLWPRVIRVLRTALEKQVQVSLSPDDHPLLNLNPNGCPHTLFHRRDAIPALAWLASLTCKVVSSTCGESGLGAEQNLQNRWSTHNWVDTS